MQAYRIPLCPRYTFPPRGAQPYGMGPDQVSRGQALSLRIEAKWSGHGKTMHGEAANAALPNVKAGDLKAGKNLHARRAMVLRPAL
eukprot:CAMPEP_0171251904 /NCGR_PEP_ID=MMETSP0790-20130122/50883_1 /TAXON_ID=2925 /ORGANISM="Alexandrium catenella, Strain OF101" /LENGTH=85 /DNA_ID=CAMNT_0011719623 /DNA_START=98 /DNA_END=352 /DNA_ORIENTATION=-